MTDIVERLKYSLSTSYSELRKEAAVEIMRLRAKITEMEKQAPFDADSDVFRSAFEAALKAGNWPATRQGDGYRSPSTQIAWRIAFSTVNRLKLYLAPGAQPAPSVPDVPAKSLKPVIDWLRNGCDPQEAAKELELLITVASEANK